MRFQYNDGGRAAAGFKGAAGDCVARAIAIAAELPYSEVYAALAAGTGAQRASKRKGKRPASANSGINVGRKWFKDYMTGLGFTWTPTMRIGQGCKVHLAEDELPSGRLVVSVSKHYTAVIDGVVNDTYNPERQGEVFFWTRPIGYNLRPGEEITSRNELAGSMTVRTQGGGRCVYGYWSRA
jgi:hypothetical protein